MRVWLLLLVLVAAKNYCDDELYCDDDETCCKVSGGFTCCPFTGAVCCNDGNNCCPGDTPVCDSENGLCQPISVTQLRIGRDT